MLQEDRKENPERRGGTGKEYCLRTGGLARTKRKLETLEQRGLGSCLVSGTGSGPASLVPLSPSSSYGPFVVAQNMLSDLDPWTQRKVETRLDPKCTNISKALLGQHLEVKGDITTAGMWDWLSEQWPGKILKGLRWEISDI